MTVGEFTGHVSRQVVQTAEDKSKAKCFAPLTKLFLENVLERTWEEVNMPD